MKGVVFRSKGLKTIVIIIAVILVITLPIISSYNNLVSLEQKVEQSASNIDTNLQRRSDLIPNLVNTVKGYAAHEEEIFTDIAEARSKLAGATNVSEQADADSELSSALSRLLVVVEKYPDLKANENFIALSDELAGTENRIAIARQDYNTIATKYNTKRRKFPTTIIASIFNFEEKPLYKADEGASEVPKVDFTE